MRKDEEKVLRSLLESIGMTDTPENRVKVLLTVFGAQQAALVTLLSSFESDLPKLVFDAMMKHYYKTLPKRELPESIDLEHVRTVVETSQKIIKEKITITRSSNIKKIAMVNIDKLGYTMGAFLMATQYRNERDPALGVEVDEKLLDEAEAMARLHMVTPDLFGEEFKLAVRVKARETVLKVRKELKQKESEHGGTG